MLLLLAGLAWADCDIAVKKGTDLPTVATECPLPAPLAITAGGIRCWIDVAVDPDGTARAVPEICDDVAAWTATSDAVAQWRFQPIEGRPNRVRLRFAYDPGQVVVTPIERDRLVTSVAEIEHIATDGEVEDGVYGDILGGTLGGPAGTPRTFHHSEIRIKKQVFPEYPAAAKDKHLGDVRCRARVFIDDAGKPTGVKHESCPKVFHQSLEHALMQWRWYPARVDGEKVPAQFVIAISYKSR